MTKFQSLLLIALLSAPPILFAQTAPKPSEAAPDKSATPAASADAKDAKPQDEATPAEQKAVPQPEATPTMTAQITRASDLTINIRSQLEKVNEKLQIIEKPSDSLLRLIEARTENLIEQLAKLDKDAMELAKMEEEFRASLVADFQFTVVTPEQRMAYMTDGAQVYDAMEKGFKEPRITRKIDGLNYYEKLNSSYRGLAQYTKANELYYETLKDLIKHWTRLKNNEERRRSRMNESRIEALNEKDQKLLDEFEEELGEDVGSAMMDRWIAPYKNNYSMLKSVLAKAENALRSRNEKDDRSDKNGVGVLDEMLQKVWIMMDQARTMMCAGNYEEAMTLITEDENYRQLLRLNRHVLPEKYRAPIVDQYAELRSEILKRQRAKRSRETDLSRRINSLQRSVDSSEAQIKAIYREIDRAKENEDRRKQIAEDRKRLEEERRKQREEARRKREADAAKK